jgi:peptidoglycan hydrolase-like protein with peptidoglycan-binding domain
MPDIYDAVVWRNLEAVSGPVLGYADGPESKWPAEALTALGGRVAGLITVLADERWPMLDSEAGNAGVDAVATAVANRLQDRLPSTVYTNADNCPGLGRALAGKGVHWTDAQFWPEPGCYLWAASPGTEPGTLPAWCPVTPVAVQDRWMGAYDVSTTFHGWPFLPAPAPKPVPAPQPAPKPPEVMVMVQVPQLEQGVNGPSVAALQRLLGGLTVDGVFGPLTHSVVVGFQERAHLAADGIVGSHTWGSLLGHPQ